MTRARETQDYNEILRSSFVTTLDGHMNDFVRSEERRRSLLHTL